MENITGRPIRVKKYSREESKEALQKYAIDIVSEVGSELKDIDVLEYITCLSEDDRRTFAHLEKKMRKRIIVDFRTLLSRSENVKGLVRDSIQVLLERMSSDELVKLTPTFEKVDADFIAVAIIESMKKSLER